MRQVIAAFFFFAVSTCVANETNRQVYEDYCLTVGGQVEEMPAQLQTFSGYVTGNSQPFCTFRINNGFIAVGLESFSSVKPSIAATFIKKFPPIPIDSPLLEGQYSNPSINFCKNIGGSSILFSAGSGGFTNEIGQTDICVFGDGSMVSGWSLIYIANGRTGYEAVKEKVNAEPLSIKIPH